MECRRSQSVAHLDVLIVVAGGGLGHRRDVDLVTRGERLVCGVGRLVGHIGRQVTSAEPDSGESEKERLMSVAVDPRRREVPMIVSGVWAQLADANDRH